MLVGSGTRLLRVVSSTMLSTWIQLPWVPTGVHETEVRLARSKVKVCRPATVGRLTVLWLVLLGFVLRMTYEVQGTVFYSRYRDSFTLFSGLFVIGLSILANAILIPPFALNGAASAIVVSYAAGIAARHVMITSYIR